MAKSTKGYCKYCGKEYTRTGMLKHLKACKKKIGIYEKATKMEPYYELMLYGKYDHDYWLLIQIKDNATLDDLDQFIRDIWVECCGHLSAFYIEDKTYDKVPDVDFYWGEPSESMEHALKEVFDVGMNVGYEYDFGSTTEITIKVLDHYKAPVQDKKIEILSRNNPLHYQCSLCGVRPAAWIDPLKIYDEDPFLCDECYTKFEEGEVDDTSGCDIEIMLPVTNSPRMGVCGYDGSRLYPEQFEPDADIE